MSATDPDADRTRFRSHPTLRLALSVGSEQGPGSSTPSEPSRDDEEPMDPTSAFLADVERAQSRGRDLLTRIERVRAELGDVRSALDEPRPWALSIPHAATLLRVAVLGGLAGLLGLALWARAVEYALRVTSDTPTFIALVAGMAERPFAAQSPFLDADVETQHATPYTQALALLWRGVGGSAGTASSLGAFLALAGVVVFAFMLLCVFLYVRRLAGTTAAWVSLPVLLGVFGPPHVIWASDLSLHAALYAGFFPQNVAMGTMLLTLLLLERRSRPSLVGAVALASLTMLVHPFTGVLLCVLATADSCRLRLQGDAGFSRVPIAIAGGFALGLLWPAYSLDRAFAETGMRGVVFVSACVAIPFVVGRFAPRIPKRPARAFLEEVGARVGSAQTAFRLALVGALGTAVVVVWELALLRSPPEESARMAIYWVDDRWRWPLLLVAGTVGVSGLARLALRGRIVPGVWFAGCFTLGALGAIGFPLPVWYRFLLLCQVPLAVGVAVVLVESRHRRTVSLVAATFALTLGVKVATLVWAPPTVSYFGEPLQPVWSLADLVPPGDGLVATDPATAYFVPSTTGRRVLTVDKGHVSSRAELAASSEGYDLLRRFYAGGPGWWQAAQEMWARGVRYVVVAKQTTLEPRTLEDFVWQTARLQTDAQRAGLGNYYYENNRVGRLVADSADFAVFRLDGRKLFPLGEP